MQLLLPIFNTIKDFLSICYIYQLALYCNGALFSSLPSFQYGVRDFFFIQWKCHRIVPHLDSNSSFKLTFTSLYYALLFYLLSSGIRCSNLISYIPHHSSENQPSSGKSSGSIYWKTVFKYSACCAFCYWYAIVGCFIHLFIHLTFN